MEEFKKVLKRRHDLYLIAVLSISVGHVLLRPYLRSIAPAQSDSMFAPGIAEGFQVGLMSGLVAAFVVFAIRYAAALKSPERMRKMYIAETDERTLLIKQKSGSVGMNIVMYGFAIAAVLTGEFSGLVSVTLIAACGFVGLVRIALKLYYSRKY